MVYANEWLNKKIPTDERKRETTLYVYGKCQCRTLKSTTIFGQPVTTSTGVGLFGSFPVESSPPGFGFRSVNIPSSKTEFGFGTPVKPVGCQHCNNNDQSNCYTAPDYCFCNVFLEGELDLNDFVNLQTLCIEGIEQSSDIQQKLTRLKMDKCIKLTEITINHTTLGYLSLGSKPKLQRTNFVGNKRLIFCDSVLRNQVERLTSLIQAIKIINLGDLKLELKKIEEENLDYQLDAINSNLDENNQMWLESLVEAQQEVLQTNSAYARKQLEKCKKKLTEVLTDEEIQDILGKKVEINELETQLNNINKLSLND
ncbi:12837_t:CDS:1 [Cetraspora pellucida]|uniref:12837_t:CDS:1 n=1 Tax=Cetraspora pellucida TaxID=1433469 RepID=A0A9N9JDA8_9GLOM|nr:12837_t:CDS:1 [Cetraspora pellucida]